ncbi:NAD(P)H-dependent oxidoreductase, partial [Tyzzerella sp. OttesenSCG-928-J15]|nr:NAD(P)H-dependent oxidoreductase [Tyzzerella sp. OttesenSCG-928-J15]
WSHNKCAIDDKMQEIYEYINEADNIVIASPIYFGEVTGSLLNWASRLQYFWVAKYMKKTPALAEKQRKGIVLLADGGMRKMESALAMAKRLLNTMGAEFCQHIYYGGTDLEGTPPPDKDTETLQKISDIAKMLNEK